MANQNTGHKCTGEDISVATPLLCLGTRWFSSGAVCGPVSFLYRVARCVSIEDPAGTVGSLASVAS